MNCQSYQRLSEIEQIEFIGYLVHIVQTSEVGFKTGQMLIEAGKASGKLDKVKIGGHAVYQDAPLETHY